MSLRLVWDASVGIKLCINEALASEAQGLLRSMRAGATVFVPDLFFAECANVLWKYMQRTGYPAQAAALDVRWLASLPLCSVPTRDLVSGALDLAARHGITTYDACYVALARRESAELVTADERLVRKLEGGGLPIRCLGK
jgi:predicted nucleic acid-binding protein